MADNISDSESQSLDHGSTSSSSLKICSSPSLNPHSDGERSARSLLQRFSPSDPEDEVNGSQIVTSPKLERHTSLARSKSTELSIVSQKQSDRSIENSIAKPRVVKAFRNNTSDKTSASGDQLNNAFDNLKVNLFTVKQTATDKHPKSTGSPTQTRGSDSSLSSIDSNDKMSKTTLQPVLLTPAQQAEYLQHQQFLKDFNQDNRSTREEEARTAPLFVGEVMTRVPLLYSQYGLLAQELPETHHTTFNGFVNSAATFNDPRIMLNVGAPWSAFICGQQGSGKSHSLSCILENCLVPSPVGKLPKPLSGMIFHWDRFTGYSSHQICEAAYLASAGIPVRVLVSPSNLNHMKNAYESIQGIKNPAHRPKVLPLLFHEKQLNVKRMLTMMGMGSDTDNMPLYMEVILRILREMALEGQGDSGLNYLEFRSRLNCEDFSKQQNGPLKLRLDLLESFLRTDSNTRLKSTGVLQSRSQSSYHQHDKPRRPPIEIKPLKSLSLSQQAELRDAWTFKPGTLTIVDLSCPFVDGNAACALFEICLELFLEDRSSSGRVVALDEAHKFLTGSTGAVAFTEELLQVIRQQRHLGTRVVIATQEPTISPKLLELCNFTLVHRFQSPGWFKTLQAHLAGAFEVLQGDVDANADGTTRKDSKFRALTLFKRIVNLQCGQALLFAPSAITGFALALGGEEIDPVKLGMRSLRVGTRQRLTIDGGRSIMAE